MASVASAIINTVPINQFNRGLAGKIFEEVKKDGAKVVMKNNVAECVLLSPQEYMQMINEMEEARLRTLVEARMEHFDAKNTVSFEALNNKLGISEEDLAGYDEVELE